MPGPLLARPHWPALRVYLALRLRLLGRLLREIGWLRLALVGALLGLSLLQGLATLRDHPAGCWLVPPLVGWSVLAVHRQRADASFLAGLVPDYRPWLAAEYALLGAPLALGLLTLRAPGAAGLTLVLAILVAWVPPARAGVATRHRWRSPFRSEAFEWVGGMRASKGLFIWPVLVGLALWQRALPMVPVAALLAWLLVLVASYGEPEPVTMLAVAAAARTPGQFLRRRLGLGLGYASITALPLWVALGLGQAGAAGAGAVALFWLGMLSLVILCKYAFYPNVSHIRSTQALLLGVGLLGVWHPAYPPLMMAAAGGLIWQSQRRLRAVLATA